MEEWDYDRLPHHQSGGRLRARHPVEPDATGVPARGRDEGRATHHPVSRVDMDHSGNPAILLERVFRRTAYPSNLRGNRTYPSVSGIYGRERERGALVSRYPVHGNRDPSHPAHRQAGSRTDRRGHTTGQAHRRRTGRTRGGGHRVGQAYRRSDPEGWPVHRIDPRH